MYFEIINCKCPLEKHSSTRTSKHYSVVEHRRVEDPITNNGSSIFPMKIVGIRNREERGHTKWGQIIFECFLQILRKFSKSYLY
jgi:hypothetical protein